MSNSTLEITLEDTSHLLLFAFMGGTRRHIIGFPNWVVAPSSSTFDHHAIEVGLHNCHEDTLIANERHSNLSDVVMMNVDVLALLGLASRVPDNCCEQESCPY